MNAQDLIAKALNLTDPWKVTDCHLEQSLCISIDFQAGARFPCPHCQQSSRVHDTSTKVLRHLNFFEHETYLSVRTPRVHCDKHGVHQIELPWSRPGSGFTLLFEGMVLTFAPKMAMSHIANYLNVHDTLLWRMIQWHITDARSRIDFSKVKNIGIDETASQRGHEYITIAVDLDTKRALFATPGKDSDCIRQVANELAKHGCPPEQIQTIACDLSASFTSGIKKYFPLATITYDRFHVTKLVTDAVKETRRDEMAEDHWKRELLKGHNLTLVTNETNQTADQKNAIKAITLSLLNLKSGRAYKLKLAFQDAYAFGEDQLSKWCKWAARSKLPAFVRVAKTIRSHWDGIVSWYNTKVTSAIMEGYNSLFQSARSRARGYRNVSYFINMVYLVAGSLDFIATYPTHTK